MGDLPVYLVFLLGGVIFGCWLSAARFMLLAAFVTIVYSVVSGFSHPSLAISIAKGLIAFVSIQLGYVGGLGLTTIFNKPVGKQSSAGKTASRFETSPLDTSKTAE